MNKGKLAEDPRGLLYEAYQIDGISLADCKTIFLDWVLGLDYNIDQIKAVSSALKEYEDDNPKHPMTTVLRDGIELQGKSRKRLGGRNARRV